MGHRFVFWCCSGSSGQCRCWVFYRSNSQRIFWRDWTPLRWSLLVTVPSTLPNNISLKISNLSSIGKHHSNAIFLIFPNTCRVLRIVSPTLPNPRRTLTSTPKFVLSSYAIYMAQNAFSLANHSQLPPLALYRVHEQTPIHHPPRRTFRCSSPARQRCDGRRHSPRCRPRRHIDRGNFLGQLSDGDALHLHTDNAKISPEY